MKTKDRVLELLEENRGNFLSGQEIADKISVTRASVWKAIKALENQGYKIDAVTNRGYRLRLDISEINAAIIEKSLNPVKSQYFLDVDYLKVIYESEITSTNDFASGLVRESGEPVLVIADTQTKGRGRRGRNFFSPKGTGIYMSLALRSGKRISEMTEITAVAAVSVSKAIDDVIFKGRDVAKIKWVNDIFVGQRKVAGILTEGFSSFEEPDESYIVIGFGINVFCPENGFPKEIKDIAGAIADGGLEIDNYDDLRNKLAIKVIQNLFEYLDAKKEDCLNVYRKKMFIIGNYVRIEDYKSGIKYAYVIGVSDDYRLEVRYDDESVDLLSSGEVSTQKY